MLDKKEASGIEEFYSYVNPEEAFDDFNTALTGISAAAVAEVPMFTEVWTRTEPMLAKGILLAHTALLDMSVLKRGLAGHSVARKGQVPYGCTVRMGGSVLPGQSHKLNDMCELYGIPLVHHKADSDSHACAEILMRYP